MRCEEALLAANGYGDNGTDEIISKAAWTRKEREPTHLPSVGDVWFDCGDAACACCASLSTLLGESLNEGFFLWDLDLDARCFEKLPSW
jgi:hypothetical protein